MSRWVPPTMVWRDSSRTDGAWAAPEGRRPVAVASLGALAVMLDSAVNIAFPAISAAFSVPATAIQGALPRTRQGVAGSVVTLMRTGGIVLGTSLTTLVYRTRLAARTAADPASAATAFGDTFVVMTGIAAAAALLALVPPRRRARPEER